MRNLLEYPITKEEVFTALSIATDVTADENGCGDLTLYILERIKQEVNDWYKQEYFNVQIPG